jgi:UDPglucose--hexose-1-phosphate uridylyltransferase
MRPHFRKDILSSNWVIVSDLRSKRPNDYKDHNVKCPFCPGNEDETPPSIFSFPDEKKWILRVVPNKYPAVEFYNDEFFENEGIYKKEYLNGVHEIVIESPKHNLKIYQIKHYDKVLFIFAERIKELYKLNGVKHVIVFRNYGAKAGASLRHPHSQIIALPLLPVRIEDELTHFLKYKSGNKKCLVCDIIKNEIEINKRVLFRTKNFIAFNPFASRFNFEVMIAPINHEMHYWKEKNFEELKEVLDFVFIRLDKCIDDLSYNLVIHTAPYNCKDFHWHIEILPKLAMPAGFEWGSGFFINSISPEKACEILKKGKRVKID